MLVSEVYSNEWHDLAKSLAELLQDAFEESFSFTASIQPTRMVIYDSEEYDEDNDPIGDLDATWEICSEAINLLLGTNLPPRPLPGVRGEERAKLGTVWYNIESRLGKISYEIQYRN